MIADLLGFLFVFPFVVALWLACFYGFKWLQKNWSRLGPPS